MHLPSTLNLYSLKILGINYCQITFITEVLGTLDMKTQMFNKSTKIQILFSRGEGKLFAFWLLRMRKACFIS